MIEYNDLFDYGLLICQNKDYFKFSIDSILLAEFVKVKDNQSILDLCSGNVPIPMILTSKNDTLKITALEIQKEVFDLGIISIKKNHLTNINLINCDIKNYNSNKKYDIITCNPPYFKVQEDSEVNTNKIKRIARHEIMVTLKDIINCAYINLKDKGFFYLVHRTERLIDVINELQNKQFGIRRIVFIITKNTIKSDLFLIEASKCKKSDPKINIINVNGLKTYKNIFEEES